MTIQVTIQVNIQEEVCRLRRERWTLWEISEHLHITYYQAQKYAKHVRSAGKSGTQNREKIAKAIEMRESDASYQDIADALGVTRETVMRWIKKEAPWLCDRSHKKRMRSRADTGKSLKPTGYKDTSDALAYFYHRLPTQLVDFLVRIHTDGACPNLRVFAKRYGVPFDVLYKLYYKLARSLPKERKTQ